MLEFGYNAFGEHEVLYRPDPRSTTYVAHIYGLGEPIELSIAVTGEHEDRADQAADAVIEVVQDLLGDPDLVGATWGDDSAGVVLPISAATLPRPEAEPCAVATFTLIHGDVDEIEDWLLNRH